MRCRSTFAIAVVTTLVAALLGAPAAFAGTGVGDFEIDGNLADDSGPSDLILDWDTPPPGVTLFTDPTGQTDNSLGQGSKELEPGGWVCLEGSAPAKDDILTGAVAFRVIAGKQYLFVNFRRASPNGDAHIDYEFNQSTEPNPACPELPRRTAGDVVIAFDTENGGKSIFVRAFRWEGDARAGTFAELDLGSRGAIWDGAVNIPNTIPGAEPGVFGEAAINLTDSPLGEIGCLLFSSVHMKTRASTSISAELKDRTDALPVNFALDRPDLANARGGAYGARVNDTLLGLNQTLVPVSSSQSGVGSNGQTDQLLTLNVPEPEGDVLRAVALRTGSTSTVTAAPAEARDTGTAETADLNVLDGLVTADLVRAVATTTATGSSSSFSSLGSSFKDLAVEGVAVNDVTPNTRIDLPAGVYGAGSYVLLYERIGSTSRPPAGQTSEGTYAADLAVNMIHVFITDTLPLVAGDQSLEVIVSHADAHSDFPQTLTCPGAPTQSVSGHAFVLSETTAAPVLPTTIGFVSIPPTGGRDRQDLDEAAVSGTTAGASVSESRGTLGPTESAASSYAQVADVCLAPTEAGCTVGAELLRAESNSSATAAGASSNDGDSRILGATVNGTPVAAESPPNLKVEIPGVGYVIFNEQFCDDGAALPNCAGSNHAGLTVRAIHLVVTVPDNALGLSLGEVIVAEAHSDASFQ
jgi:hypothetical protein